MSTPNSEPNGSENDCIFDYVEKQNQTPVIVLPLSTERVVDVWSFLSALHEVLINNDTETASEMVEWLGCVIYDSLLNEAPKKPDRKTIAQIYRKETENFDERLEQFLRSLESDGNGKAN